MAAFIIGGIGSFLGDMFFSPTPMFVFKFALDQCARSAVMVKSFFFSAQYQRLSVRRGKKRAIVAVAHSMRIAIYHLLKNGETLTDLGADYDNQFNRERKVNALLRRLHLPGWEQPAALA